MSGYLNANYDPGYYMQKKRNPSNLKDRSLPTDIKISESGRFRADSNCCRSFCRALPNRSATEPFENGQK
jgi:hypothetical protein